MRNSYITNPYSNNNNIRNGELNFSKQTNVMPCFLTGSMNNNGDTAALTTSALLPQSNNKAASSIDNKVYRAVNLRRAQSITARTNMPPISNTWAKSPPSTYLRSKPTTEERSNLSFTKSPATFNQSNDRVNQSFNESFLNQSNNIKECDTYNRFMQIKTEANEDSFENWVTVFGYGPNQSQSILGYFTDIGPISNKIISNNGNWMHLQYETKMHAISALNKNGRIINSLAMIGVKPCDDKTTEIPFTANINQIFSTNKNVTKNNAIHFDNTVKISKEVEPDIKQLNVSFNNSSMRPLSSQNGNNVNPASKPGMLNRALSLIWK